jgi:hypothetical protein
LTRGEAHDRPVADRLICRVQRAKRMLRRLSHSGKKRPGDGANKMSVTYLMQR